MLSLIKNRGLCLETLVSNIDPTFPNEIRFCIDPYLDFFWGELLVSKVGSAFLKHEHDCIINTMEVMSQTDIRCPAYGNEQFKV